MLSQKLLRLSFIACLCLMPFFSMYAQERVTIPRIKGEFRFDGVVDDECWSSAQPLDMIMHTPTFGNKPTEKSEVFMCYDNTFLYVGARMFDSNPGDMLVTSKRRDEVDVACEMLCLIFDSFNDKENGLGFATSPTALRSDFTVAKDAMTQGDPSMGNGPLNMSWNTFWDVKTSRNDQGWFCELRIPFSSMRFKDDGGKVVMGLICMRSIAHKNEISIYPAIPPNWGDNSILRVSKGQEIVFEGLSSKKPFYIAPYAIGGLQVDNVLNGDGTAYVTDKSPKLNAGLDIKYGLTNNLTMDLTLNTDFAQVEADNEQINLTRFSLFFPEKRTFFQERSSVFTFDFEPQTSLFYSRRIGINEGEQVPIYGGARITGMAGRWDIGFMDMQTQPVRYSSDTIPSLPSENFGILRLRRQVINESSYVGGVVTTRIGADGSYNTAYGADGIFKIMANDYLDVKLAQVIDNHAPNKMASLDPTRLHFSWNRYNQKGLNYGVTYSRSGRYFDPGVGFQMRSNYAHYYGGIGYGWIPGEEKALQSHQVGINAISYFDNADNTAQSFETGIMYDFRFKSGYFGMASLRHQYENVTDTFSISADACVPPGKYGFNILETHFNSPQTNKFFLGVDFIGGSFYDGNRVSFGVEPQWNIGSSLQLALKYDQNFVKFGDRGQSFSGGVAGFKALVMFTTSTSISAFIQYNSAANEIITNLRFRYNPREGNDFYIVFNEGRNTYRDLENPRLPLFSNRVLLLKYTYTFTL